MKYRHHNDLILSSPKYKELVLNNPLLTVEQLLDTHNKYKSQNWKYLLSVNNICKYSK